MEPTPTADLDRSNDRTYDCTTAVVRAVMALSQGEYNHVLLLLVLKDIPAPPTSQVC